MQNTDRLISPGDAAEMLGVGIVTLRNWIKDGLLSEYRTAGGHRRFNHAELAALMQPNNITLKISLDSQTYAAIATEAETLNLQMPDMIQGICRMYVQHLKNKEPNERPNA